MPVRGGIPCEVTHVRRGATGPATHACKTPAVTGHIDETERRTVIVPLDGTTAAESALPLAVNLAQALGADMHLVRVIPVPAPVTQYAESLAYLREVAARPECEQVATSVRVMRGQPGECIVRAAGMPSATLLVTTTHARSGIHRAVLGSVAEYLVAHAPVSTLLMRVDNSSRPRLSTLLVTLDLTGAAPLQTAIKLARATGARLVLLRVVLPEEMYVWQWQRGPILAEPQAVVTARQQVEDLRDRVRAAGVDAQARVVTGVPVPTILSQATEVGADLIIMATHARTGLQRAVQGSVADAVMRAAAQPVLLCRVVPTYATESEPIDVVRALRNLGPATSPESIPQPFDGVPRSQGAPGWHQRAG